MSHLPIVHGSFTIERDYPVPVGRVFAAWSDVETKARWFIGPPEQWKLLKREQDFRVGGRELLRGQFGDAAITLFTAQYHVIVPDERIVYVYDMHHTETHLSTSLASVEFVSKNAGTRMTFTEHAAFLDGKDGAGSREIGTNAHFERLGEVLCSLQ